MVSSGISILAMVKPETTAERIRRLYLSGQLSLAGLKRAKAIGWITQEEYDEIISAKEAQDQEN